METSQGLKPFKRGRRWVFMPTFLWESEFTEEPFGSQLILLRFRAKLEIVQGLWIFETAGLVDAETT